MVLHINEMRETGGGGGERQTEREKERVLTMFDNKIFDITFLNPDVIT